jgi:hypothetical protein
LVGDATIFHFIAGQVQMGAVPYRDIFDINMPLIYYIHAAVVAIGGMTVPEALDRMALSQRHPRPPPATMRIAFELPVACIPPSKRLP